MSIAIDASDDIESLGFPELTALGKQIEVLRIGRGLSKQHLARHAGTSRQQLWRVMTGKSELTGPLRLRLADALRVPESVFLSEGADDTATTTSTVSATASFPAAQTAVEPLTCDRYLTDMDRIERTLRTMPNGDEGRSLKRALLNALEDLALDRRIVLAPEFFDLRRRVLSGEL